MENIVKASREDLLRSSYHFTLPSELIAQRPLADRKNSRLLYYDQGQDKIEHHPFLEIVNLLPKNSVLALNRTKVFPCRLRVKRSSGGRAEIFFLDLVEGERGYEVLIKTSRKKKVGDEFLLDGHHLVITHIEETTFFVKHQGPQSLTALLIQQGEIPIPPYIRKGVSDHQDQQDYQTVFAENLGSVAAPTAGLHFNAEILEQIKAKGIQLAFITLHVGLGTFLPVKCEHIIDHQMHAEKFFVDADNLSILNQGLPIYAVGTTSLRALESLFDGKLFSAEPREMKTSIFIYPGKEVRSIAGLLTNFHLPESSLLMLVSAIIGRKKLLSLYTEAIKNKYRFFSYGDCMLIKRNRE